METIYTSLNASINQFLDVNGINYETNVNLKKKTWIHRGGYADYFIKPSSIEELQKVVKYCYMNNEKFELIGHTSNLYFLNNYNPKIVISTSNCNKFSIESDIIECECGAKISIVAKNAIELGIKGFEYLTTLPGTVGGALYNNSSCRENSVANLISNIEFLQENGEVCHLSYDDMEYSFRTSILKQKRLVGVILKVTLKAVKTNNATELIAIAKKNEENRKLILEGPSHNLGCTFDTPFINGKMPFVYYQLLRLYSIYLRLFYPSHTHKAKSKVFLLTITGYSELIPYISDKQMITYVWKDENADEQFPKYVEFMNKIYKTDKIEIEVKGK